MAGTLIELLRITSDDMTSLASSQSSLVLIEPYVNVMQAREASLVLRLHSTPSWAAGASIRAEMFATDQCRDDPSLLFGTSASQASAGVGWRRWATRRDGSMALARSCLPVRGSDA